MSDSMIDLSAVAQQTGLSSGAVQALFEALVRGGGTQAQFNHPDLGGHGQWMRSGMLMIGEMFNDALKAKVAAAAEQLAPMAAEAKPAESASQSWWPEALGQPRSVAAQDDVSYALFGDPNRIAVRLAGEVKVYDVGDATAEGVGMQNGKIVVHTSRGTVPIQSLKSATLH